MVYVMLGFLLGFWVDFVMAKHRRDHEIFFVIALLQQQLQIIARQQTSGPQIPC